MATLAEVVGQGWGVGSAIGDDISQFRFERNKRKTIERYEQQAAAEGKTLDDYLPQIEEDLRRSAQGMFGVDSRGVRGAGGQPYSRGAIGTLRQDSWERGEREAGALSMAGNHADARDTRARAAYRTNQYDVGVEQQHAGDMIRATSGATGADGLYDAAAGASALSGVDARYGNHAGAATNADQARQFRFKKAGAYGSQLFMMAQNPQMYTPDQVRAAYTNLQQAMPEMLGNTNLQVGNDGAWNLYANGSQQATGSWNMSDPQDFEEFAGIINQFSSDPEAVAQSYREQLSAARSARSERTNEINDRFMEAQINLIGKIADDTGMPASLLQRAFGGGSDGGGGGGGFQVQDISSPGMFMIRVNGQSYVAKVNPNAGPGEEPVQYFRPGGSTPVSEDVMSTIRGAGGTETIVGIAQDIAKGNGEAKIEAIRTGVQAFEELRQSYLGNGSPARAGGALERTGASVGERNNNRGNIRDVGQFRNTPGYRGTDERGFAIFDNAEEGDRQMERQLGLYFNGQSRNVRGPTRTIAEIVPTWAPVGSENSREQVTNYIRHVSSRLGVDPNEKLTEADIPRLAQAMAEFETGKRGSGVIPRQGQQATAAAPARGGRPTTINMVDAGEVTQVPIPAGRGALDRVVGISPQQVQQQRAALAEAEGALAEAESRYSRFQSENGGQQMPGLRGGAGVRFGLPEDKRYRSNDPAVARVGGELLRRKEAAEARVAELRGHVRRLEGSRQADTRLAAADEAANAMAAKYDPGMADFFGTN